SSASARTTSSSPFASRRIVVCVEPPTGTNTTTRNGTLVPQCRGRPQGRQGERQQELGGAMGEIREVLTSDPRTVTADSSLAEADIARHADPERTGEVVEEISE